jgi:hypothetical protein
VGGGHLRGHPAAGARRRKSFATGCTTLTGSSAGPWPTGC